MPLDRTACHCVVRRHVNDPDPRTRLFVDTLEQHGRQVVLIPADDRGPGWARTVGLWRRHRVPELAMFGWDVRQMQVVLNDLGRRAVAEGQPLDSGRERRDVGSDPVVLEPVDHRWYRVFFGTAIGSYGRPPLPFRQVVRPDRDGVFSWQPGGEGLLHHQPGLWLRPEQHPVGVRMQDV
ncbi:hypothetical protein GCM10010129_76430 [Streptomyces fumigatiscleroticus]|nr:hypothetical protein GCM10010129_76430 [Streptomyces fumigatiscleroticus]